MKTCILSLFLFSLAVGVCARSASAAILTWDASGLNNPGPTDGSGSWDTTISNWANAASPAPDVPWSTGNTAQFGVANGAAGTVTITDGSGTVSAAGINFNAAGTGNYTIAAAGANTLTLTSPTITIATG